MRPIETLKRKICITNGMGPTLCEISPIGRMGPGREKKCSRNGGMARSIPIAVPSPLDTSIFILWTAASSRPRLCVSTPSLWTKPQLPTKNSRNLSVPRIMRPRPSSSVGPLSSSRSCPRRRCWKRPMSTPRRRTGWPSMVRIGAHRRDRGRPISTERIIPWSMYRIGMPPSTALGRGSDCLANENGRLQQELVIMVPQIELCTHGAKMARRRPPKTEPTFGVRVNFLLRTTPKIHGVVPAQ
mmetsp:Transcript_1617/g.4711  ORF Transcript_1617/g.4711 Transcript_1617/m.4711 type:complete len:242 (-) Transcript_1617:682-1407(-)